MLFSLYLSIDSSGSVRDATPAELLATIMVAEHFTHMFLISFYSQFPPWFQVIKEKIRDQSEELVREVRSQVADLCLEVDQTSAKERAKLLRTVDELSRQLERITSSCNVVKDLLGKAAAYDVSTLREDVLYSLETPREILDLPKCAKVCTTPTFGRGSWTYRVCRGMYHPYPGGDPGPTKCAEVCTTPTPVEDPGPTECAQISTTWLWRPWIYWACQGYTWLRETLDLLSMPRYIQPWETLTYWAGPGTYDCRRSGPCQHAEVRTTLHPSGRSWIYWACSYLGAGDPGPNKFTQVGITPIPLREILDLPSVPR